MKTDNPPTIRLLAPPDTYREPSTHRQVAPTNLGEGRIFGGLVLAAFLLYGIGSAQAEHPFGLTLVALNSVAVTIAGLIGFRLLRSSHRPIGTGYLVARLVEAVALASGIAIVAITDSTDADTAGYLLAMFALGLGSVPFCLALARGHWLPSWLAWWGLVGYSLLSAGALIELVTGRGVTVFFAAPGGLFELTLGLYLLARGFGQQPNDNSIRLE